MFTTKIWLTEKKIFLLNRSNVYKPTSLKDGDRVELRQLRMQAPAGSCRRHNWPVLISWWQCTNFSEYVRRFATFSAQHNIHLAQQNCKKLQSPIRLWRLPCRGWILTSFWHYLIISSQKSTQTSLLDQLYSEILTWTWWSIKCASDTFHPQSVRSLTKNWASWFPRCGPPTIVTPWEMSGMRYSLTRS